MGGSLVLIEQSICFCMDFMADRFFHAIVPIEIMVAMGESMSSFLKAAVQSKKKGLTL